MFSFFFEVSVLTSRSLLLSLLTAFELSLFKLIVSSLEDFLSFLNLILKLEIKSSFFGSLASSSSSICGFFSSSFIIILLLWLSFKVFCLSNNFCCYLFFLSSSSLFIFSFCSNKFLFTPWIVSLEINKFFFINWFVSKSFFLTGFFFFMKLDSHFFSWKSLRITYFGIIIYCLLDWANKLVLVFNF